IRHAHPEGGRQRGEKCGKYERLASRSPDPRPDPRGTVTPEYRPRHDYRRPHMRIAIVNDLALAREVLRRGVLSAPGHTLAWTAVEGEEAVRRAAEDRPDAILMDLVMPRLDGAEATRRIMRQAPCAILVVTSTVTGNFDLVYRAMGAGALDAVETPA